jgi:acyl-CoA synthetase (AMP-forming)/AMP-acid ligase II
MNEAQKETFSNQTHPVLVHHFLEHRAHFSPEKVALVHDGVRMGYSQINNKANHLANYLIGNGIGVGDRVALLLDNSLEYVVSYYGCLKTGGCVVPLNTDLKPENLGGVLNEIEPKVVISSSKFENLLKTMRSHRYSVQELILGEPKQAWSSESFSVAKLEDLTAGGFVRNPKVEMQERDLASIIYTSGSTGRPNGAMLTHRNIVSNTVSICKYLHLTQKDIQMVVLPFYYVMGKSLLNTHFAVGGTVVVNNKFAFPAAVLNEMVSEKVTGFSGVPSTYAFLLHRSPLATYREKLTSLRYCSQAGGHMPRVIKEGLREVLPTHTDIYIMYGATEASARLSYLEPRWFQEKIDSIGKAIPGVHLRVLDEKGREVPIGQTGELVASGDNIMSGYWKDSDATARVLDQNGYHTGDLCYQDREGFFYIVGRRDNLIKVGGHRINPQEIEDALMETGLLAEVVILGMPDELLGKRMVALMAPKDGNCSVEQIANYCTGRLPKFQVPSEFKIVRRLPNNSNGKIDVPKCFELAKR